FPHRGRGATLGRRASHPIGRGVRVRPVPWGVALALLLGPTGCKTTEGPADAGTDVRNDAGPDSGACAPPGSGTLTTSGLGPQIAPDRAALHFGLEFGNGVYVGTTITETVAIWNLGASPLTLSSITVTGPDAARFAADQSALGAPIGALDVGFVRVSHTPD